MRIKLVDRTPTKKYKVSDLKTDYWYDKSLKLWTILVLDPEGNQVGNVEYTTSKQRARDMKVSDFDLPKEYK